MFTQLQKQTEYLKLNRETMSNLIMNFCKNGFYIHIVHAFLQNITRNTYLSAILSIKLYSTNYFYWYGHLYSFLPNPRYNWVKQFIRFTDTGHLASVLPLFFPAVLPVAHNVHFIIMAGYWIGKLAFDLKDADRMDSSQGSDIIEWHMDWCTYIHHTVPYAMIHLLWKQELTTREINCAYEYSNETLIYTYGWLYVWFTCIYLPWRLYTGDAVYSILDLKQTPMPVMFGFIGFIHLLIFISNMIGYTGCRFMVA